MAEVRDAPVSASPEELVLAAYPRRLRRARALAWLSFIAAQSGGAGRFGWWQLPVWIGQRHLRWPRRLAAAALIGAGFALAFCAYISVWRALAFGYLAALGAAWLAGRIRSRLDDQLLALVPRRPRGRREALSLAVGLVTGVLLRPTLVRQWRTPVAAATPDDAYRACQRSALFDAAGCLVAGLPLALPAWLAGWPLLFFPAGVVTSLSAVGALASEPVVTLWLAGNARPPRRQRRRFLLRLGSARRLLRDAERYGLLRARGNEYVLASDEVRDYLIGREQVVVDANTARAADRSRRRAVARERSAARAERKARAAAAAGPGPRRWLLSLLSETACTRLSAGLGLGIVTAAWIGLIAGHVFTSIAAIVLAVVFLGLVSALVGVVVVRGLLALLVDRLNWSLWLTGRMSSRAKVAVAAALVGAAGLITLGSGPAAVRHALAVAGTAVLPGAVVAVVGGWGAALVHQRLRDSTRLPARRVPGLRRIKAASGGSLGAWLADALAACVTCVALLLWAKPTLLGAQAAAALLFPLAVWLSVRLWRAMTASDRIEVRAAADITVSLLLGASLTGLLVCLANIMKMPPDEVSVLKDAADRAGGLLDVPWWAWAALYAALAAVGFAFLRWPDLPRRLGRAARRLRVRSGGWTAWRRTLAGTEVLERTASGAHIGLLLIALVGAVAPVAVGPVLRARLASQYTQTLTDAARAEGAAAELRQIAGAAPLLAPTTLDPLLELVIDVHHDGKADDGQSSASAVELDLAGRLGLLQAQTLTGGQPQPPVEQLEADTTRDDGLDAPAASAGEDGEQLGELGHEEHDDEAAQELADQAGDLAASALAKALGPIPGLGDGEVIGLLKEYLSALIEVSSLKDTFAAWAEKLGGRSEPPAAADVVVPDPARLDAAAATQARQQAAVDPVSDPTALKALLDEGGISGAVALANQTRYLQEDATGPCDGCARPESGPGSDSGSGGSDHSGDDPGFDPGF